MNREGGRFEAEGGESDEEFRGVGCAGAIVALAVTLLFAAIFGGIWLLTGAQEET